MFSGSGATASPAWNVRLSPSRRAASNAGANAEMSMPSSVRSAPIPMIRSALPAAGLPHLLDELEARARPVRPVHVGDEPAPNSCLGLGGLDALGQPGHDLAEVLAAGEWRAGVNVSR